MVKVSKKPAIITDGEKQESTFQVLKKMRQESEEEKASALAKENNLPYIDLNLIPVTTEDVFSLPEKESRSYGIVVFQKGGKDVRIATHNPKKEGLEEYVAKIRSEKGWDIHLFVVSMSSLEKIWNRYKESPMLENLDLFHLSLTGKDLEEFESKFKDLLDLKNRISEIPTTQIMEIMTGGAIKMEASDIHFEPQSDTMRLRYRIDGMLQDIGTFPLDIYHSVLSRIKMMGKMKINLRDVAQDGHFSINIENRRIDIRVNIIPGRFGESTVMRLLDQSKVMIPVESLGLRGLAYERVQKEMVKTTGMILTTGPTGSGKTTTLYSLINKLNEPDVKIITIEDPVEYELKGISQTQIAKDRGYTFAEGLRAIVRQDPDIILVGEIRDEETADIAINSALTGHLVLSTLHTNNAPATIPRLLEMGIKPSLIPPASNAFIAQRLVRVLCSHCKEKYVPAKETTETIKRILSIISPKAKVEIPREIEYLYRSKGCTKCHNTGYKGRLGIFEIMTINEEIEKLILEMAGESDIMRAALEDGMITMTQDGIMKAVEGITSMEEVWRITGQIEFLEDIYDKLMAQSLSRSISISESDLDKTEENISSFEKINKLINSSNPKEVARIMLACALIMKAGDIHIEPGEKDVKIRYRIDGMLQTVSTIPLNGYPALLGEIKLISGFKTETREGVIDGRFAISLEKPIKNSKETKVDVRVSIILGGFGETVVMRILSKSAVVALDINMLGIRKYNLDKIMNEAKKHTGIFLNTGPTGSGKTTTLYSLLKILNTPDVKIITVEDPIEFQLEGILQTQANDKGGYDFSTALKSLLRQNPDILMIGEIRDEETANIATQAALTGHLILSTLHTNDAASTIQRIINMGIRPDDLATASNAFMAQRLVRKLCDCKQKASPTSEEAEKIKKVVGSISPKTGFANTKLTHIYKPKGCVKCNNIGYIGRTTICEILQIDEDMQEMISRNALSAQIKEKAVENGMLAMEQDGILKALEGETSLEEVERVVKI